MRKHLLYLIFILFTCIPLVGEQKDSTPAGKVKEEPKSIPAPGKKVKVYKFNMKEEIGPPTWRQTQEMLKEAEKLGAEIILIHMDTYGGEVYAADKIRSALLDCKIPVYVFIDDNAASAGALISIACDSIYMSGGGTIGSATVVDGNGHPAPEKYQSYMRSRLRATAEQTGRDPRIAEGFNDSSIVIPGIKESGKVLAFTASEAMKNGYCEGQGETVQEILESAGITNFELQEYVPTSIGKIIDFLINPFVSGLLIMIMIGGIYFEMKSPGIGFPLFAAITAAILYFAPHYLEGLAAHWEILVFVIGLILLGVEIFVIPGFGVVGIAGIVFMVMGLALALIDAIPGDKTFSLPDGEQFIKAIFMVVVSIILSTVFSFYFGGKLVNSNVFMRLSVKGVQRSSEGYVVGDAKMKSMVGIKGVAFTDLRPSGKVEIGGESYDATAEMGYIEKGKEVVVIKMEAAQLFVRMV